MNPRYDTRFYSGGHLYQHAQAEIAYSTTQEHSVGTSIGPRSGRTMRDLETVWSRDEIRSYESDANTLTIQANCRPSGRFPRSTSVDPIAEFNALYRRHRISHRATTTIDGRRVSRLVANEAGQRFVFLVTPKTAEPVGMTLRPLANIVPGAPFTGPSSGSSTTAICRSTSHRVPDTRCDPIPERSSSTSAGRAAPTADLEGTRIHGRKVAAVALLRRRGPASPKAAEHWTATGQAVVLVIACPSRHRLMLAAVVAGVAGCGGHAASRQTAATGTTAHRALQSAPTAVAAACHELARSRALAVRCPTRLPEGRWAVNHRTLRNGRCAYLLDLNTRPFGQNIPFHALAGGRCGQWPLTSRGGRWPANPAVGNDLGLIGAKPLRPGQPSTTTPTPVPPRVLRRVDIAGHHGLLLQQAAYPTGGVQGGHVAAIWNQGGDGYVLSLHFTEPPHAPTTGWRQMVIDAAAAMSRSSQTIAPPAGAPQSQRTGNVVARTPAQTLRRRGAPLNLTGAPPRSVKRACATAAANSKAVVYCPPLVPTGRTLVDGVDGIIKSRDFRAGFVANFESHSVEPSRSAPGHWSIAEGEPETLRTLLDAPNYDPRNRSIRRRQLQLDGTIGHAMAHALLPRLPRRERRRRGSSFGDAIDRRCGIYRPEEQWIGR